jgi:O-antigen/teichoic acid export membrane protein
MTEPAEQRPAIFRIVRNAASMFLGDLGGDALTTVSIGMCAVALGPALFGVLSEAQAFMDPFETAAGFGLAQVAITVAARRGGCDATLRGTVFALRGGFALVAIVVANVAALASGRTNLLPVLFVLSVSTLFSPLHVASTMPFMFDQTMHRLVALPFLASVVRLATTFAALKLLNTPVGYQVSIGISSFVGMLLAFGAARKHYPVKLQFDRVLASELLRIAWPAAALEFTVVLYMKASYFLLHEAGPTVQGEYAAAERLTRPMFGIATALLVSALPTLASIAAARDFRRLGRIYATAVVRTVSVGVPVITILWFFMPWLLRRFVPEYAQAVSPFRWLAVATLFMLLNHVSTTFVVAMAKFRAIMIVALVNFVVYFALAIQWIPRYRATGAAMATATMEVVNTLIQLGLVYFLLRNAERERASI